MVFPHVALLLRRSLSSQLRHFRPSREILGQKEVADLPEGDTRQSPFEKNPAKVIFRLFSS
jgi:hypothetical protein